MTRFSNLKDLESFLQNSSSAEGLDGRPTLSAPSLRWVNCPHCEASCVERTLSPGQELRCARCGSTVFEYVGKRTLQPAMALSMTGVFVLLLANTVPVLNFEVVGRMQSGFIITGVTELINQGYWPIAALVFFAGILAPFLYLGSICYVSTACVLSLRLPWMRRILAFVYDVEPWNLVPVYSIATVVAVVKLNMLGTVDWEPGARWILSVAILSLFAQQTFNQQLVEERLELLEGPTPKL